MEKLTEFEESVLNEMLSGDEFSIYREQLNHIKSITREYTGVGFFVNFIFDDSVVADSKKEKLVTGDIAAEIPSIKHGAGFALFINEGLLEMLEGYTYDEPWPDDVSGFVLKRIP